jgi:hypothetical protein
MICLTQQATAPICADSVGLVLFTGTSRKNEEDHTAKKRLCMGVKIPLL